MHLAKTLTRLTWAIQDFVAGIALAPPTVQVDKTLLEQYQKEMDEAAEMPLPDEDDPDL